MLTWVLQDVQYVFTETIENHTSQNDPGSYF